MYELSFGKPLFSGENENEVIEAIASVVPIPHSCLKSLQDRGFMRRKSSIKQTTHIHHHEDIESGPIKSIMSKLGDNCSLLMKEMLQVDPEKRFDASECLTSAFFNAINLPPSDTKTTPATASTETTYSDDFRSNDYEEDSDFEKDDYSEEFSDYSSVNSYRE